MNEWLESILTEHLKLEPASLGKSCMLSAVQKRLKDRGCDETAYREILSRDFSEREALALLLTVPESWFFRHAASFHHLQEYARQHQTRFTAETPMRLLSSPCASGEEPYSIAMTLLAGGLDASRFHIDAVDINDETLNLARAGTYRPNAFREKDSMAESLQERFFSSVPGENTRLLDDVIRRLVRFQRTDLLRPQALPGKAVFDVIFCRNLLIYLNDDGRERLFQMIHQLLKPDGLCYVGPTELLPRDRFEPIAGQRAFRRLARQKRSAAVPEQPAPAPSVQTAPSPKPQTPVEPDVPAKSPPAEQSFQKAERLANAGQYAEAADLCREHLQTCTTDPEGWRLMGLIHLAADELDQADTCFQKVLYLDTENTEALEALAMLASRRNNAAMQQRYRERLERIAQRKAQVAEASS